MRKNLKNIFLICIISMLFLSMFSCQEEQTAYEIISEFTRAYGATGIIYSPHIAEGQPGYVGDGLIERAYHFSGRFPDDYAILLNSHTTEPSECGAFICQDADTLASAEEFCLERVRLLGGGFVKRRGRVVYYSTMQDAERAERLFKEIIN